MSDRVTIKMEVDRKDLKGLFNAFKELDKDTNEKLRTEVYQITDYIARSIKTAAEYAPMPDQARLIAETVRPRKDRVPYVTIGGSKYLKVSRRGTPGNPRPRAGQLLFGSEFGASPTGGLVPNATNDRQRRFPYFSGKYGWGSRGYWIFPTLRRLQPKITSDYHAIIDKYIRKDWADGSS